MMRVKCTMATTIAPLWLAALTAGCSTAPPSAGESESALAGNVGTCTEDLPVAGTPGVPPDALDVYFTMPVIGSSEVDCRTIESGDAIPEGRLMVAFWQMGGQAGKTPVTWHVSDTTGFSPGSDAELASFQRGPNNLLWSTAAQMRGSAVGMWINSGSTNVPFTGEILPVVAHYDFPAARTPMPFRTLGAPGELSFALDAKVPSASRWGAGVSYAATVFRFKDTKPGNESRQVWLSIVLFDPRGAADDSVILDGCSTCSGYPILLTSYAPSRRFGALGPGSSTATTSTFSDWRHFDYRISPASFAAALAETKQTFSLDDRQLSGDPADYSLVHFSLDPEVYAPAGGGASIGFAARALSISRVAAAPKTAGSAVADHVTINAANGSRVSELQVFFKTATSNFYDERKSLRVPFPTGGGNVDVVADFSTHPDWHGTITGLRIDPFDSRDPAACFNVDTVTLGDGHGHVAAAWNFDGPPATPVAPFFGWSFSGLERLWSDGRYWGACQHDGDPYFFTDLALSTGR
jgi:hypothetical protein